MVDSAFFIVDANPILFGALTLGVSDQDLEDFSDTHCSKFLATKLLHKTSK